jgi:cytochrome d ubiquinol oxidase subunit II
VAQFPYLVPPALTFHGTAAPTAVLQTMIGALAVGAFLLVPSFVYLYRVFKRR